MGVLLGLSGLDIFDGDATPASPFHQHTTDIFRAVFEALTPKSKIGAPETTLI
jgi:hypothetical protein